MQAKVCMGLFFTKRQAAFPAKLCFMLTHVKMFQFHVKLVTIPVSSLKMHTDVLIFCRNSRIIVLIIHHTLLVDLNTKKFQRSIFHMKLKNIAIIAAAAALAVGMTACGSSASSTAASSSVASSAAASSEAASSEAASSEAAPVLPSPSCTCTMQAATRRATIWPARTVWLTARTSSSPAMWRLTSSPT